jgi:hypothetical protein
MNPEKENFEPLCRLLKLKRHEQPPPRYFNDFSSQVVARIRAGDAGHREAVLDNGSWLMKLWSFIDSKPMVPGAVGVAFCVLLVFGAVYTEKSTSAPGPDIIAQPVPMAQDLISSLNRNPSESRSVPVAFSNTTPVIRLDGSLFDQVPLPPTELISRPFNN